MNIIKNGPRVECEALRSNKIPRLKLPVASVPNEVENNTERNKPANSIRDAMQMIEYQLKRINDLLATM